MDDLAARNEYLHRLRQWRNRPQRDLTLSGLGEYVDRTFVKPSKHLGQFVELWEQHVPAEIQPRTALAKFHRGVLTVHVADSATLYDLDRLMRGGLERRIAQQAKTTLRKIRLAIARLDDPGESERRT
jgi:hypothetical protein